MLSAALSGQRRIWYGIEMIESIAIEKCTGCGICDVVCPADVIHMEPVAVGQEIAGLTQTKLLPVIKFREHCIT